MRREPTVYGHKPVPVNPNAQDSLFRNRKWARCAHCSVWLIRLTRAPVNGWSRPDVWQHRQRAWH